MMEEEKRANGEGYECEDNEAKATASDFLDQARNHGSSEFISLDKLHELRMAFELADEDGGGGLDLDEFVKAFGHVLGNGMNQRQLTNLFMKIDANSDGSVDWAEFTEYMLLENRGTELMKQAEPRCEYLDANLDRAEDHANYNHTKRIIRVNFIKALGAYASCSEDGTVKLWQAHNNLNFLRTVKHKPATPIFEPKALKEDDSKSSSSKSQKAGKDTHSSSLFASKGASSHAWCNDCCFMHKSSCLAVATGDRTISFFDCNIGFECVGRIRPLSSTPLHLAYYCGPISEGKEVLICADDNGYIHVWHLEPGEWKFTDSAVNIDRRAEKPVGVIRYFRHRVHDERINQLEFDPIVGSIISCGSDGRIQLTDIDKRRIIRSFCCHEKPVYAFVYIANTKLVASAGADRQILFWNPYTCAVAQEINGDEEIDSPILRLCLNEKEHQLISLSSKNVIRVWDLSTYSCIQIVSQEGGRDETVTDMIFDKRNNQLVLTNRGLTVKKAVKVEVEVRKSHQWPVTQALYNNQFHQLVSAASFEVHVWDIYTGRITFRFINPHGGSNLTAMCFDVGGRRLLTGAHDGSIKMWNFNNGACLGEFVKHTSPYVKGKTNEEEEDEEVTSLACFTDQVEGNGYLVSHDYIVATGRDRKVFVFSENKREFVEPANVFPLARQAELAHFDDVNCVVYCEQGKLATAGDDGRVIVWSLSSGVIKQRIGHSGAARRQLDKHLLIGNPKGPVPTSPTVTSPSGKKGGVPLMQLSPLPGSSPLQSVPFGLSNNMFGDDEDTSSGEEDENEEKEDEDIVHIRSLVKQSTWSDLLDIDNLRRKLDEKNTVKTSMNSKQNKTSKVRNNFPQFSGPLSAREGKEKAVQWTTIQHQKEKREKKRRLRGVPKPDRLAVENLLYLKRLGCICTSGADGFLRFWNPLNGDMQIEMDAGHSADESIVALSVDEELNRYIFTGDTAGKLKVWDIKNVSPLPLTKRGTLKIKLLNEWVAHRDSSIVSMVYLYWTQSVSTPLDLLITASSDCSVLLWSFDGSLIGMFGQEYAWSLTQPRTWAYQKSNLVKKAKKIGEIMQNFSNFTTKMKNFTDVNATFQRFENLCKEHAALDKDDEHVIQHTRLRNKFKLNYLKEIEERAKEPEVPISATDILLQAAAKSRRKPKASEMPQRPSLRQQVQMQQVMHRMSLPSLVDIKSPSEMLSRVTSSTIV